MQFLETSETFLDPPLLYYFKPYFPKVIYVHTLGKAVYYKVYHNFMYTSHRQFSSIFMCKIE